MSNAFKPPVIPGKFLAKISAAMKQVGYSQREDETRAVFSKKGAEVYFRHGKSQHREWIVFSVPIISVEEEIAPRILSYLLISNYGLTVQVDQTVHFVVNPENGIIEVALLINSDFVLSPNLQDYLKELVENFKDVKEKLTDASKALVELIEKTHPEGFANK
jgi:hypothetical protein